MIFVECGEDFLHRSIEALHGDRALFAGFDQPAEELFAVEGLPRAVFLDHTELGSLDLLVGRVAIAAAETLPTTTNRRAVLRHSGIDDFVLLGTTLDAPHLRWETSRDATQDVVAAKENYYTIP